MAFAVEQDVFQFDVSVHNSKLDEGKKKHLLSIQCGDAVQSAKTNFTGLFISAFGGQGHEKLAALYCGSYNLGSTKKKINNDFILNLIRFVNLKNYIRIILLRMIIIIYYIIVYLYTVYFYFPTITYWEKISENNLEKAQASLFTVYSTP